MEVRDAEYQAEYDKAAAELEAAAQATTARDASGRFAKAEPAKVEPEQPKEEPKPEVAPEVPATEPKEEKPDELAELRARVEKAEKIAKDNQAWATKLAQERAQEKREREQREREANKPAILDANPGLEEAVRYVTKEPAPQQQQDHQVLWNAAVEKAHPGIFTVPDADELVQAITKRRESMGESWADPLEAIRVITEEKLAQSERQVGKRFAAEAAKLAQKSAMSVPGAGAGSGQKAPIDVQLAEVQRIQGMSDADFQKEVRRVKGF